MFDFSSPSASAATDAQPQKRNRICKGRKSETGRPKSFFAYILRFARRAFFFLVLLPFLDATCSFSSSSFLRLATSMQTIESFRAKNPVNHVFCFLCATRWLCHHQAHRDLSGLAWEVNALSGAQIAIRPSAAITLRYHYPGDVLNFFRSEQRADIEFGRSAFVIF